SVCIEVNRSDNFVVIGVQDSGVGIPHEEIPHVWERLYRGDKSRSQRGLGLGLSLVKAIAQAHAGRCDVESAPGAGSLFRLHLPVVWGWANGLLQYRDLFDNHSPLFQMLCAPLFHALGERADIIIPMRLAMIPLSFLGVWCAYKIAARLTTPLGGWIAAALT